MYVNGGDQKTLVPTTLRLLCVTRKKGGPAHFFSPLEKTRTNGSRSVTGNELITCNFNTMLRFLISFIVEACRTEEFCRLNFCRSHVKSFASRPITRHSPSFIPPHQTPQIPSSEHIFSSRPCASGTSSLNLEDDLHLHYAYKTDRWSSVSFSSNNNNKTHQLKSSKYQQTTKLLYKTPTYNNHANFRQDTHRKDHHSRSRRWRHY